MVWVILINVYVFKDSTGHIKLADFGLSIEGIKEGAKATSFCGSPAYLTPEMLKQKGVSQAADIYGIGAVMYELLVGLPPYYSDDIPYMYQLIQNGKLQFPRSLEVDARDLILVTNLPITGLNFLAAVNSGAYSSSRW